MHGEDRPNIRTQLVVVALKFVEFPDHISIDYGVGYKMKTYTQISDSGFRGKLSVVRPGDSAKRASPGIGGLVFLQINTTLDSHEESHEAVK